MCPQDDQYPPQCSLKANDINCPLPVSCCHGPAVQFKFMDNDWLLSDILPLTSVY